jgi:hypothetical protein
LHPDTEQAIGVARGIPIRPSATPEDIVVSRSVVARIVRDIDRPHRFYRSRIMGFHLESEKAHILHGHAKSRLITANLIKPCHLAGFDQQRWNSPDVMSDAD